MKELQLIKPDATYSFQVKVTQKILKSHELSFLRTHIQNKDILLSELSYFSFYFHEPSLSYDIIVYERVDQNYILGLYLCKNYIQDKLPNTQSVLLLFENHFCFYYKNNLVTLKKINTAKSDDIQSYIEQAYKVKIDKIVSLPFKELEKYQKQYQKSFLAQDEKQVFKVVKQKSYLFFQYFVLVATAIFVFLLFGIYQKYEKQQQNKQHLQTISQSKIKNTIQKRYQEFQKQKEVKRMVEFLNDMEKYKIQIKQINYEKGNFIATVFHQKKQNLMKLLKADLTYLDIDTISYKKEDDLYTMELKF